MADNDKVDEPVVEKEDKEELSDVEQDAVNAISDVKGEVTDNEDILEVEEPSDEAEPAESDGKTAKDDSKDADEGEPSTKVQPETKKEEVEKDEAGVYEEPKTPDPGDFKPGDYSFEIKTTDGKTHKITTPEDADALVAKLDEDPEMMTASQFSLLNRKTGLMEQGIANDKKEFEASKAQHDREQELVKTREDTLNQWNSEINYLQGRGELPEISAANNAADWSDPEVAKDPAVKARLDLLTWMETENKNRMASGLEPMKSLIDANNAMRLDAMRSEGKQEAKTDTQRRRTMGAKVKGNAPFEPDNSPKESIIGLGGSLNDLVREYSE